MTNRLSILIAVLVCIVFSFHFFLIPQEAQIVISDLNASGTEHKDGAELAPEGGVLYFVNTTSDMVVVGACQNGNPGCSLRGAIQQANTNPNVDGIDISIPASDPFCSAGVCTINLTSALPDISTSMGITGPGANALTVKPATGVNIRVFNVTATGTVSISGLTISNGVAPSFGGGILNNSTGTVNVINCTISGNATVDVSGGGIANIGTMNVTNSTISGNRAAFSGGGIFNFGTMNITNSTISGNEATLFGGGIYNAEGTMNITNSTISYNITFSGGNGGGVENSGTANVKNCIIAWNPITTPRSDVSGNFVSAGFNLIGKRDGSLGFTAATDQTGTVASPLNPMLGPLQNNGGPTRTIALLSGSPAIDKGTSSGLSGNLTTDQRGAGFPRTFDEPAIANAAGGNGTDIGAFERGRITAFDFDDDSKSDVSVFRPSSGVWHLLRSQLGYVGVAFGQNGDLLTPADFDDDRKTDVAVFRPAIGTWYRLNSSSGAFFFEQFGANGDLAVPADFDGDGKADLAVFRPSVSTFFWKGSSNGLVTGVQFGLAGDKPAIGDFDGDGKADISVYRPSNGGWFRLNSSNGSFSGTAFGIAEDNPTPADYDGDGKTDISVYRPSTGAWYRLNSSDGSFAGVAFGTTGDKPVAADYDGDGKAEIAVFRPSIGYWFMLSSINGAFSAQQFGTSEDFPTPNAFVY